MKNYSDWENKNPTFQKVDYKVPKVCCKNIEALDTADDIKQCREDPDLYKDKVEMRGCTSKVFDVLKANKEYVVYTAIGILVVMVRT